MHKSGEPSIRKAMMLFIAGFAAAIAELIVANIGPHIPKRDSTTPAT
ncbi:MAG TPA: hypothetical protein VFM35_09120 [Candidatus Binatia bacterium]|nr:hypothetical protein [Candidatus Binatia bacterium]